MTSDQAETLALQALAWILANDDLRPVFMGATGVSEGDLRSRATEADMLVSVLDFVAMDDAWLIAFCDSVAQPYTAPMAARQALPGGGEVHWT